MKSWPITVFQRSFGRVGSGSLQMLSWSMVLLDATLFHQLEFCVGSTLSVTSGVARLPFQAEQIINEIQFSLPRTLKRCLKFYFAVGEF